MTQDSSEPGPITLEAQALQVRQSEVMALSQRAFACITNRPAEAYKLCSQALQEWNDYCEAQESFHNRVAQLFEAQEPPLKEEAQLWRAQLAEFQSSAAGQRTHLLFGMAQSAFLLDNLREAREALKQALEVVSADDPVRPALRQFMLNVLEREAEYGSAETYESLLAQYEDVYQEYLALEQWEACAQTKERMAVWASKCERRAECLRFYAEAIEMAESHQLVDLAAQLRLNNLQINSIYLNETPALPQRGSSLPSQSAIDEKGGQVDSLMFDAKCHMQRQDYDSAIESLSEALKQACEKSVAQSMFQKRCDIHQMLGGAYQALGRYDKAIKHAEKALRMNRASGIKVKILSSLVTLISLRLEQDGAESERAEAEIRELEQSGLLDDFALALVGKVTDDLLDGRFEQALPNLQLVERYARSPYILRQAVKCKVAVFYEQNRYDEALDAIRQALSLYDEAGKLDAAQPFHLWHDVLADIEVLHMKAAQIETKFGHAREAFAWFESGRAQRLRYQLTRAGLDSDVASLRDLPSFEEVRAWLDAESVSVMLFGVLGGGTVAILLTPQADPQAFMLPLTGHELKELLPLDEVAAGSESWTPRIFDAVPELSEKLLHPISDALAASVNKSRALYLIPDQALYLVPFAALTLKDKRPLVEHCPVAFTPSVKVLQLIQARRASLTEQRCLAVGVGQAETTAGSRRKISFVEQAEAVGRLSWAGSKVLGDETLPEQFLAEARGYSVLHISCHGVIAEDSSDALSASQLQFKHGVLTAKDIFALGGELNASLVFMNACQSGRFRASTSSEVEGFVRGFIHAGASTVIAPLIHINAEYAEELALEFYTQWLTNAVTKAEALRLAQLKMMSRRPEQSHWASYVLYGDHV